MTVCLVINTQESEENGPIYVRKLEVFLMAEVSKVTDQTQSPSP